MPQSLAKLYVHLVFSTKNRFPFLKDDALRVELHAYLATVLLNLDCPATLINSVDDRGACLEVAKMDKPTISPFSNAWNPALNALLVESNSLESGTKNQLAGVRDE